MKTTPTQHINSQRDLSVHAKTYTHSQLQFFVHYSHCHLYAVTSKQKFCNILEECLTLHLSVYNQ